MGGFPQRSTLPLPLASFPLRPQNKSGSRTSCADFFRVWKAPYPRRHLPLKALVVKLQPHNLLVEVRDERLELGLRGAACGRPAGGRLL